MTTSSTIARRRSNGFTLVELTLVIVLIALLCSVAFPRMTRSVRATGVRESSALMADLLRFVRTEAVRRQLRTCFRTNEARTEYWFQVQDADASSAEAFKAFGDAVLDETQILPIGVHIARMEEEEQAMSGKSITFTPDGASKRYRIVVQDDSGQRATVEVGAWCDQVKVVYGRAETGGMVGQ